MPKSDKVVAIERWIAENHSNYPRPFMCDNAIVEKFGIDKNYARSIHLKWRKRTVIPDAEPIDEDLQNGTSTDTNQYKISSKAKDGPRRILSAYGPDGKLMNIEAYCKFYGIPFDQAKTYKLVTHTGVPFYNIASNVINEPTEDFIDVVEIKRLIAEDLALYKIKPAHKTIYNKKINVVKISDLHFGAYVNNLIKTRDYSVGILMEKLVRAADIINEDLAEEVHVHILGDLIESFTGLNHKNTWKGVEHGMVGAEVVKMCCKILHESFLSRVHSLKSIKVVAGNHDRVTSDKGEDTEGGAANLISWGLGLIGYDVEFHSAVIKHVVDGICHIIFHGHHGIAKLPTRDLCWMYGQHGVYNLLAQGHLHSITEKLSAKKINNTYVIKDDEIDHRRIVAPSFFTGNEFSENLGYSSNSGIVITRNNGRGIPHMLYYAI